MVRNPPSERYVDIMVEGATKFGVKPEYIAWLKAQEVRPRKPISELKTQRDIAEVPADLPTMTEEEVANGDG